MAGAELSDESDYFQGANNNDAKNGGLKLPVMYFDSNDEMIFEDDIEDANFFGETPDGKEGGKMPSG